MSNNFVIQNKKKLVSFNKDIIKKIKSWPKRIIKKGQDYVF